VDCGPSQLARYFSQQELFAELQQKQDEKSEQMQEMRNELSDLHANKLTLQGQMESEANRVSTTALLDAAQKKCGDAQKILENKLKRSSQLEVVLVEAKEILLRATKAAQPLSSLQPLLLDSRSDHSLTDVTADGSSNDGSRRNDDGDGDEDEDQTRRDQSQLQLSAEPVSWEAPPVQILRQFDLAASKMYATDSPRPTPALILDYI
jgi:hypothetical protein